MRQSFDPHHRFRLLAGDVAAAPPAERAFVEQIVRMDEAFERDLGMGGDRQPGARCRPPKASYEPEHPMR